jgi:small GTP-binding protein
VPKKESSHKIVLVGDAEVGKTSLVLRYATSTFETNLLPTLGVNILAKEISIEDRVVTLVIWDIGALEYSLDLRKKYYSGASLGVLVYDVTRRKTFENVRVWCDEIKSCFAADIPVVLVGNKTDLLGRAVSKEEGDKLAREIHTSLTETSAKTGENVRKLFQNLVGLLV